MLAQHNRGIYIIGRSCRWVDGAVRQQCAVHLPFERQATVNGGFPILPTGSTDPERSLRLPQSCRSGTQGFHEFRCSEAAVRDLTHPATTGPSRLLSSCRSRGSSTQKTAVLPTGATRPEGPAHRAAAIRPTPATRRSAWANCRSLMLRTHRFDARQPAERCKSDLSTWS